MMGGGISQDTPLLGYGALSGKKVIFVPLGSESTRKKHHDIPGWMCHGFPSALCPYQLYLGWVQVETEV